MASGSGRRARRSQVGAAIALPPADARARVIHSSWPARPPPRHRFRQRTRTGSAEGMVPTRDKTDRAMMARCIELSRLAVGEGEYPFGTVIALDGQVIAEATNRTVRDADVSRHAEVIALSLARRTLGLDQLRRSTLYSNIEPCAMCSYCIREAWVGRVVYAIGSPVMGGLSKWDILRDHGLSERMPQV